MVNGWAAFTVIVFGWVAFATLIALSAVVSWHRVRVNCGFQVVSVHPDRASVCPGHVVRSEILPQQVAYQYVRGELQRRERHRRF